jgi:hypothetical protein
MENGNATQCKCDKRRMKGERNREDNKLKITKSPT